MTMIKNQNPRLKKSSKSINHMNPGSDKKGNETKGVPKRAKL